MFQLTVQWLVVAVDVSVKALLLAALAVLAMRLFELRDSNVRHRIWLGVLMAMLLLPALSQLIPALGLPVPVVAGWATSEWGDVEPLDAAAARLDAADTEPVAVPESLARGSSVRDSLPFGFNHEPWNEPAMEPARHGFSDDGDWGMMAPPLASDVDTESMDTTSNPAEHAEPALAALASQYDPLPFRSAGITVWLPLVLFAVWLTGATVMGLRLLLAMFFTWQLKRRSHRIEWDALARLGIDLQQWSSRRPITVAESSQIGVPLTAGALRPWILLPAGWNEWPAAKLRAVLTHEGTHVERGDCAVALLAEVNRCLYWFHPLAWWLRRRLYALAEEACDDAAIKTTGDRALYARHLLEVASVVSADQGRLIHTGVSMARRSNVETRIHAILDFTRPLSQRLTWSTTLLLSAVIVPVIVLAAALTPLSGQDESIPAQEVEAIVAADVEESDDQEVPEADGQDISQSGGGPDQVREYPIESSGSSTLARSQPSTGLGNDSSQTAVAQETKTTTVTGRVTSDGDRPAREAHVAVIAMRMQNTRSGEISPSGDLLAEGTTDENGRYELKLAGVSSKTHRYANVVARKEGAAIAWRQIDLDADNVNVPLQLLPEEPIRGRVIDIEGRPAADVRLLVVGVAARTETGNPARGAGYRGGDNIPAAWLPPVTSDELGRFTLRGVPADHGVSLQVAANDRFAPQGILLNTGMSEQRGERDRTYRSLVRNVDPGEEAVLALSPAQWFEGVVRYEDADQPAPNAPVTIWASQQEFGSMSLVSGKTDEKGRYRINPHPGIRFGVTAYPPEEVPYLARRTPLFSEDSIRWEAGDTVKQVDMTLPRGVLVRGQVINADTKAPIAGAAVQYHPESLNNPYDSNDIVTGWNAMQVSDEEGRFAIPVLPGPGRLLVHGPQGEYVLHEIGERQLSRGTPGGIRYYAHAIENLDPQAGAESIELEIELQPGATVTGRIVDERGEPIEEVQIISRLDILASVPFWRGHTTPPTLGGRFEISGLAEDQEYPVYFLDAKRKLGATEMLRAGEAERTVVLQPCGTAHLRLVDSDGEPVAGSVPVEMVVTPGAYRYDTNALRNGELAADSDFLVNIDRTNYSFSMNSDDEGRFHLPALIPGASYRIVWYRVDRLETVKEFQVEPNETLELGDIVVEPQQ